MQFNLVEYINENFVVFCTIVFVVIFSLNSKNINPKVRKYFYILCAVLYLEATSSSIEYFYSRLDYYSPVRCLMSVIGYVSKPALMYVSGLLLMRDSTRYRTKSSFGLPIVMCGIIASTSFFCSVAFSYTEDNVFISGPLYHVLIGTQFFYVVFLVILCFASFKKKGWECAVILLCIGLIILNMVVEVFFYSYGVYIRPTILSMVVFVYYMFFQSKNHFDKIQEAQLKKSQDEKMLMERMFESLTETLSSTIDVKDHYTQGHSQRVANYSRKIAELAGLPEAECKEVYYAGLLHDIGKIAIPEDIINKPAKLTDEEYGIIKTHPVHGNAILEKMNDMPYLRLGAHFHHEKYDGTGYPEGIKGDAIPRIARIIAVADTYDAMSSKRSYRDPLPQSVLRAELVKGKGTQFDPAYADIMINMIDNDTEYTMKEK